MGTKKGASGDQIDLIDVAPKNAKPIIAAARVYKKLVLSRLGISAKEVAQKAEIIRLVRAAKIPTQEGGKVKFTYEGVTVSITPRDELVQVTEKEEVAEEE